MQAQGRTGTQRRSQTRPRRQLADLLDGLAEGRLAGLRGSPPRAHSVAMGQRSAYVDTVTCVPAVDRILFQSGLVRLQPGLVQPGIADGALPDGIQASPAEGETYEDNKLPCYYCSSFKDLFIVVNSRSLSSFISMACAYQLQSRFTGASLAFFFGAALAWVNWAFQRMFSRGISPAPMKW
jgi:hypothetical protein